MKKWLGITMIVAAAAIAAGVAYATIPDENGVIHGCLNKAGVLRVVDTSAGGACSATETQLDWSQKGPAGPPGPPGPQGDAAPAADAVDATMTVTAQGFDSTPVAIIGVSHEIVSPRDAASGLPTGKRQHKPLTITKEIDQSTPLLMKAIFTNQTLPTVKIAITDGTSNTIAAIELTNASVASHSQAGNTEKVSFTYQKITWTWVDGGVSAQDDWEAPVG